MVRSNVGTLRFSQGRQWERLNVYERGVDELWSVHDESPFVGDDNAGTRDSPGKVLRFQGQSYKFPPRIINTEFDEFGLRFCKAGGAGSCAIGRALDW
jgi:hypothetical protein